jgi:preprotein translocase subunit SecB
MTDAAPETNSNGPGAPSGPPAIRILAQFTRDVSFENPRAPESLQPAPGQPQPQIELGVELSARGRVDGLFEVDMKLNVGALREGAAVFQLELVYGGLFQIAGVSENDLEQVLLIECPRFLFPFARRIVADLTADGGFPPFQLEPIDFLAVYAARKGQEASATTGQIGNA